MKLGIQNVTTHSGPRTRNCATGEQSVAEGNLLDRGDVARSEHALARMHIQSEDEATSSASAPSSDLDIKIESSANDDTGRLDGGPAVGFFVDTTGSGFAAPSKVPLPVFRSASPTPSTSSEEVVVFRGRNAPVRTIDETPKPPPRLRKSSPPKPAASQDAQSSEKRSAPPKRAAKRAKKQHEEDEIIADYLENIRQQEQLDADAPSENQSAFLLRILPLMMAITRRTVDDGWDPSMLNDFDGVSTSEEMLGEIERILHKREREAGPQYLVVYEGYTVDDARWIPSASLTGERHLELITIFESSVPAQEIANSDSTNSEEEDFNFGNDGFDDDSDDDDEDDEDEINSDDDFEDETDLIERKIARMTDEKIAQLLAKQEELGMGSDELLLFDDDDGSKEEGDEAELQATLDALFRPAGRSGGRQRSRRAKGDYPSASLMADVLEQDPYNGFDIMDFERPSIKKSKGRQADMPFELSDDELQTTLRNTWEADRKKKRRQKAEREELRAQGLLGKKNKFKPDLNARYGEGMNIAQLRLEIEEFVRSSHTSRALPPMDKRGRALVHQFASPLGLKSKSVGSGKSRFTTLIKTTRTREFDERLFSKVEARMTRSFIPRMDKKARKGGVTPRRSGGGGITAGVSYTDGEVVGANAPELGVENKGRALLEKMGWTQGTALGALNNKGILQPIAHTVKTGKAGLG
ncbi:squalene synthetase-like protein [Coniosporium tulheliwenetii]|uniref:Squalene synthetase-like protein n=1 Tax=Coniosporium tulheliwenetii TaxID=3383036 RepID=A0ACC2ZII2_9PEZI|nr:squalene synthetase-like protein [Cladosporium sp. JES 115]